MKRASTFFRICWDCKYVMHTKDIPEKCEKCGGDNLMSYYEYYMEEPYEEEKQIEVEEEEYE